MHQQQQHEARQPQNADDQGVPDVQPQADAGDGGGEYYEPTVAQTALRGKKWEGDVASAAVSTTNANMIDVKITIDDSVGGFTIREMGLFDDDGTLIAICNTPDTEKVSTDGGVSGKLTMIMHIVVADASVVSFTITPALDTVSRAEMESALAEHNTNGTSHSDIRVLALNAVQQGDVPGLGRLGDKAPVEHGIAQQEQRQQALKELED